ADAPVFTAVTVKPNTSGSGRSNLDLQPGGRFVAINVGVMQLVTIAYGDDGPFTQDRLIISDVWAERRTFAAARYDIQAVAERELSRQELPRALQQLLNDRFKLKVHRERRSVPSYDLL